MKTLTALLCAIILNSTFFILHSFATSYTWNGTTSTAWATTTNWTPSGTPGSSDDVTIVTTSNQPALSSTVTVTNFTITSGTLNLGGYTLNVTGTLAANGGTINNGTLNASGSATATFAGTVFNCTVTVVCNDVYLNGSEFNAPASFTKNSSGDNYSNGGNTFNDAFTIIHNGSGILGLGVSQADEFNALATFTANDGYLAPAAASSGNIFADDVYLFCSGTDGILMNYAGTAAYSGTIYLACDDAAGTISFGQSGGSATLASGKTIMKDAAGFDLGQLIFNNFTKYGTTPINLAFGDYTALTLGTGNVFNGNFTFSGGHYYLNGTTFNHAVSFSQNYDLDSYSSGGNTFNGNAVFIKIRQTILTSPTPQAMILTATLPLNKAAPDFSFPVTTEPPPTQAI